MGVLTIQSDSSLRWRRMGATPIQAPPREVALSGFRPQEFVRILTRRLESGGTWFWANEDDASVGAICGEGGGCRFDVADGNAAIWIPLIGSLQVATAYMARTVSAGDIVVTGCTTPVQACAHGDCRWLAIVGDGRAWTQLLTGTSAIDRQLLPEQYVANHALYRQAMAIANAAGPTVQEAALRGLADLVASMQWPLYAAIARCPGRTYDQQRQVFVRLQRVRLFMTSCCERELDNCTLAHMASYSPHHFLRTFKSVYLETPHAYLVRQRLSKARRLLLQGRLAITEIALDCGFESPSAFSRLFRQRFGTTAQATRRRLQLDSEL